MPTPHERVAARHLAALRGRFITDFGPSTVLVSDDGTRESLPRYGVWGDKGHRTGKAEVLEVSDDLDALQRKYGPGLPVQRIP